MSLFTSLFGVSTKEQAFWRWFEKHQNDLYSFEKDTEAIFDRLAAAMWEVNQDLTFEFGPILEDGSREFVISAGGIKEAFPYVETLHAAAPQFSKWKILKYRQRRDPINDLHYADREIKASDVHYVLFNDEDPQKLGLIVFFEGYVEQDRGTIWGQVGYLFLDEALGEYDVETHVGQIVFSDRKSKFFKHARPLAELPSEFDERIDRSIHDTATGS